MYFGSGWAYTVPMQTPARSDQADTPCTTRARGRPRAFDRDAALAHAMRLFWQKGYAATSIADLTQAMGIAAPSLYAAFGSKDALYVEALNHYADLYGPIGWQAFLEGKTARASIEGWLLDSARLLTGGAGNVPLGCMVTLSAVGSEGHQALGELVRSGRASGLARVRARLAQGVADGDLAPSVDLDALARFAHLVQNGMSIQARDGVGRAELEAVARIAMLGWDALVKA